MLTGSERLGLQGINTQEHRVAIDETKESVLVHLTGNAINFFSMSQGIVAAVSVLDIPWFE